MPKRERKPLEGADHYTCTECGTESDKPATCTNSDCLRERQELIGCECTDGEHGGKNEEEYYAR